MALARIGFNASIPLLAGAIALGQNPVWTTRFGVQGYEDLSILEPDGEGGVYAGGIVQPDIGGLQDSDAWIARYDRAGAELWRRSWGTGFHEVAELGASDGAGGLFVSGFTDAAWPSAASAAWLTRLRPDGQFYGPSTPLDSTATALCADDAGGVYLARTAVSYTPPACDASGDFIVERRTSAGALAWSANFATPWEDCAAAICSADSGGAIVAANVWWYPPDHNGCGSEFDELRFVRYDAFGNHVWTRPFGSPQSEWVVAIVADGADGFYACGVSNGAFGGPITYSKDAWVGRFDASGAMLWTRKVKTPAEELASGVALDGFGGVVAFGETTSVVAHPSWGGRDLWLANYRGDGTLDALKQLGAAGHDGARRICGLSSGRFFAGGVGAYGNAPTSPHRNVWLGSFELGCADGLEFCTSSTTTSGCRPTLSAFANTSATSGIDLTLQLSRAEGQRAGLIFYGLDNSNFAPAPWTAGSTSYLCVKSPVQRSALLSTAGASNQCNGQLTLDWNSFVAATPNALGAPFSGGETVFAQAWFRDPPAPKGVNTSNAVRFVVCP